MRAACLLIMATWSVDMMCMSPCRLGPCRLAHPCFMLLHRQGPLVMPEPTLSFRRFCSRAASAFVSVDLGELRALNRHAGDARCGVRVLMVSHWLHHHAGDARGGYRILTVSLAAFVALPLHKAVTVQVAVGWRASLCKGILLGGGSPPARHLSNSLSKSSQSERPRLRPDAVKAAPLLSLIHI